jgi:hypothetical protein
MAGDVDANLLHDFDGEGMDITRRLGTGAPDVVIFPSAFCRMPSAK